MPAVDMVHLYIGNINLILSLNFQTALQKLRKILNKRLLSFKVWYILFFKTFSCGLCTYYICTCSIYHYTFVLATYIIIHVVLR